MSWKSTTNIGIQLTLTVAADAEDLPIPATLNLLGTIRVTFYRAKARKRAEPRLAKGIMPLPSEAIPEDVLKGQGIKSKVRYVLMCDVAGKG